MILPRVSRYSCIKQGVCILIPEYKFTPSIPIKINKSAVVVFSGTLVFDRVSLPALDRVDVRKRILPPPDFITSGFTTEYQVHITVLINVIGGGSRFYEQRFRFDDDALPSGVIADQTDQCRCLGALSNKYIVDPVVIDIRDQAGRLFGATIHGRYVTCRSTQVSP